MSTQLSFKKTSLAELQDIQENGERAKALMQEGTFFKEVVVAELEKDLADLEAGLVWKPGATENTTEKIALDRVWKSGVAVGIARTWATLNRLKNEGTEAGKELGLRKDKKEV